MRWISLSTVCVLLGCESPAVFHGAWLRTANLPSRYELREHHGFLLGWADFTTARHVAKRHLGEHEVIVVTHPVHWVAKGSHCKYHDYAGTPTKRLRFSCPSIVEEGGPLSLWHGKTLLAYTPWFGQWALAGQHPQRAVFLTMSDHAGAGGPLELTILSTAKTARASWPPRPKEATDSWSSTTTPKATGRSARPWPVSTPWTTPPSTTSYWSCSISPSSATANTTGGKHQ